MKRGILLVGVIALLVLVSCPGPAGPTGATGATGPSGTPIYIQSITIADGGVTSISYNGTLQFTATVLPSNATNQALTWSVVDQSKGNAATGAIIEPNGVLVGYNGGSENVTVTASANDGSSVQSNAINIQVFGS
jgi:uncharacterized protein YjdB